MSYERYASFLSHHDLQYQLVEHEPVRTISDVEEHIPELLSTMVKTIAFEIEGALIALVAVRGADRIDYKKVAGHFNVNRRKVVTLSPVRVSAELQVEPGGVAPIPLCDHHTLIIDKAVYSMPLIHTGSGRFTATLALEAAALAAAANATVLDVVK